MRLYQRCFGNLPVFNLLFYGDRMTDDEIIEMSSKAGFNGLFSLIVFARMVAEVEREECAKLADEYANGLERNYSEIIADKIRARGDSK